MADAAIQEPATQQTIELPNGVIATGMGGDTESLRIQFEEQAEDRTPEAAPAVEAKTNPTSTETATTEAPKKPLRGQARFDALTNEREEAKRVATAEKTRADAAEARAKELEAKLNTPAQPRTETRDTTAQPVTATRPKPTEDAIGTKYQSYAEFVEDLTDWKSEQREAKLLETLDARSTARIEADRTSRNLADRGKDVFAKGRELYTDFDAVLNANNRNVSPAHRAAILAMPNPEHVLYALAKDDSRLEAICNITDAFQLGVALSQVMPSSAVASPASTAAVVRTTNVPAPPQPVTGASTRTTKPSLQELAESGRHDEYKAARAAGQVV